MCARAHVRKEEEREKENEEDRESAERKTAENHRESTVQLQIFYFFLKLLVHFPITSRPLPNGVVSGTFGMALLLLFLLIPRPLLLYQPTVAPRRLSANTQRQAGSGDRTNARPEFCFCF